MAAIKIKDQSTNQILFPTIMAKRAKKLIILPAIVVSPYIGTNKIRNQTPTPKLSHWFFIDPKQKPAAILRPVVYHQNGNLIIPPIRSTKKTLIPNTMLLCAILANYSTIFPLCGVRPGNGNRC